MKATTKNIEKYRGQKVWALIFVSGTKNIKYLNIVTDLGVNNTCSGGFGNGIISNFIPFIDGFKIRYERLWKQC